MRDVLRRLPDPQPNEWVDDFRVAMRGGQGEASVFGNFWARRPCRFRDHDWQVVGVTEGESDWPRHIRRCSQCGSQVHQWHKTAPPQRGKL